jgi:hypothetical protein
MLIFGVLNYLAELRFHVLMLVDSFEYLLSVRLLVLQNIALGGVIGKNKQQQQSSYQAGDRCKAKRIVEIRCIHIDVVEIVSSYVVHC